MRSAHKSLITLAKKLGYTEDVPGLCHGTTLRCLEAYLLGEQDVFIKRVNAINATYNLDGLILEVQEKVKRHEDLTDDEKDLLDILAFYDSIFLYQEPDNYPRLFNQSLYQSDVDEISHLASSERIQEKGGLSTLYAAPNCFTPKELKNYLDDMQTIITNQVFNAPHANIGMIISSINHTMGLFYQAKNHTWTLMDINQWPPFEISTTNNTNFFSKLLFQSPMKGVSKRIRLGFDSNAYTACNISLLTTQADRLSLEPLRMQLHQLSTQYPVMRVMTRDKKQHGELLLLAATDGHADLVRYLLADARTDPNQANIDGETPLSIAAAEGRANIVRDLLADARTDPNQATKNGETPLCEAAAGGDANIVRELLADARTNPNQATKDGRTPLWIAASKGHADIVRDLLADARTDPNQANKDGVTPLLVAAQYGHFGMVKLLLNADADPNQGMLDGATPLFTAILSGHLEVARILLDHKSLEHQNNTSALIQAAQNGYNELVREMFSDEKIRAYYLKQILLKPDFMQGMLIKNDVFVKALVYYRSELCAQLQSPEGLGVSEDIHKAELESMLHSREEKNLKNQHPLNLIFNTVPEDFRSRLSFIKKPTHLFLNDIETYLHTTYPEHQGPAIKR